MRAEVRAGLTAQQKSLPSKYFYDACGSELFELITELPEYYQTRTELSILQSLAVPLAQEHGWSEVVEIGSGSSKKTLAMMDALHERGHLERFIPIDVSESILREAAETLLARYPGLRVQGIIGDFMAHLGQVPPSDGRRLVMFLGSTIGNLDAPERLRFLQSVRGMLGRQDHFLVGMDLVKDVAVVEAAYNDSQGVTAEFNRNVLRVVNRELNADFVPEAYHHRSFFNVTASRIEMHLAPESPQTVHVQDLDLAIECLPNETIFTEISCKYTQESATRALELAGLKLADWYTDPQGLFGVALATRD
ncbi:MAG: L-histidine N(alpha)-methyltransferase [Chloroflexota bacterium]